MTKKLLDAFHSLDSHTKDALADIDSTLLLSLATLDIASEMCGIHRLSSENIMSCLDEAGVAVKKRSVINALTKAGSRVSTSKDANGETVYKLMTRGKREIENLLGGESMSVVRIEGGQPRTARYRLGEILSNLKGDIRVCDPYYGVRTLDTLDHIPKSCSIKFLTAKTSESGRKIQGALKDFKKERSNVEFRIADKPNELHDRYLANKDKLILLGHGLKDIGGKESFMINLESKFAPDLIKEVKSAFDTRWKNAKPI